MKILQLLVFTVFFLFCFRVNAQAVKKISVRKIEGEKFFFEQKTTKSDTIIKNKNDLFYLIVSDTLKSKISIQVENGQLQKTNNDSIVRLIHMKGLNYESSFEKVFTMPGEAEARPEPRYYFKTLINGVPPTAGNEMRIRFKVSNRANPLLEEVFFYKE